MKEKPFEHGQGALELVSDSNREALVSRGKALDAELRTFVLGFAIVLAMALVAGWWVWCEHDAELVEARAKVEQMERRIADSRLNAQELRALYRMKMRRKQ